MKRSEFLKISSLGVVTSSILKSPALKRNSVLIKPPRLNEGDTIGFTAPAGIVYEESEFQRMTEIIESFGLHVQFGEYVRKRFGYLAGSDFQRASDLNRFFKDPAIKGIIAVRGGWGCARILEHLDFEAIRNNPKIYCGFSDNTTLHMAFHHYCGLVMFHGPNGTSEWTDLTKESFTTVLMDGETPVYPPNDNFQTICAGTVKGRLIGGNLSILETALGTPYQPDVKNAILFVEDIGEPAYKIDRMISHLKHAGILEQIGGFVFGQCTDCEESSSENDFSIQQVLDHHIKPLDIPAVTGVNVGHDPGNVTLPIGIQAELNASSGTIRLLESGVL